MTNQPIFAILEIPDRGAYSPNKFGCRYGDFIKHQIKGEHKPSWIFEDKIYELQDPLQLKEFNDVCAKVIPHCHQRKMRVIPRIITILQEEETIKKSPKISEPKVKQESAKKGIPLPKPSLV